MKQKILIIAVCTIVLVTLCVFGMSGCNNPFDSADPDTYTIQYTDDTGLHQITVASGELYGLDVLPQREGYNFAGLYDAEVGGAQYVSARGTSLSAFTDDKNIILYAQYIPIQYSIILNYNGAEHPNDPNFYEVDYNAEIPELATNLWKSNMTFVGWFTKQDGQGLQVADASGFFAKKNVLNKATYDISSTEINLYAYFTHDDCEVTIYIDGSPKNQKVAYNSKLDPFKIDDGRYAIGFTMDKNGKNLFEGRVTEDITLYALIGYKISFDTKTDVSIDSVYGVAGETISLPVATDRAHDKFLYWDYNGQTYTDSFEIPEANVILTAKWNPAYQVSFDTQTDVSINSVYGFSGETISLPVATGREYDKFMGWEYDGQTYTDSFIISESNVTLTAKWNLAYEIKFYTQNEARVSSLHECAGETISLPVPNARKYDTFLGWEYKGQTYTDSFKMPGEDVAFTAKWNTNGWTYISTAPEFKTIQMNADKKYCLLSDISLGEWTPLGSYSCSGQDSNNIPGSALSNYFMGTLDGNGHTISYNITIDDKKVSSSFDYGWALVGYSYGASFLNIKLNTQIIGTKASIGKSLNAFAGGITAWALNCTFSNCESYGKVYQYESCGTRHVARSGGLVGMAKGCKFTSCANHAYIHAQSYYATAGGICGGNISDNTYTQCSNDGTIVSSIGGYWFGSCKQGDIYSDI